MTLTIVSVDASSNWGTCAHWPGLGKKLNWTFYDPTKSSEVIACVIIKSSTKTYNKNTCFNKNIQICLIEFYV